MVFSPKTARPKKSDNTQAARGCAAESKPAACCAVRQKTGRALKIIDKIHRVLVFKVTHLSYTQRIQYTGGSEQHPWFDAVLHMFPSKCIK